MSENEEVARTAGAWRAALKAVRPGEAEAASQGAAALLMRIDALPSAERAAVRAALCGISVADACARRGREPKPEDYERRARALEKAGLGVILAVDAVERAGL